MKLGTFGITAKVIQSDIKKRLNITYSISTITKIISNDTSFKNKTIAHVFEVYHRLYRREYERRDFLLKKMLCDIPLNDADIKAHKNPF